MEQYKLTRKAVEDLSMIWKYTCETWSEKQADKYYHFLIDTCEEIAQNPNQGKKYPNISEQQLGFKAGRHILFYKKTDPTEVIIIRILHEQMDLENRIIEK